MLFPYCLIQIYRQKFSIICYLKLQINTGGRSKIKAIYASLHEYNISVKIAAFYNLLRRKFDTDIISGQHI